MNSAGAWPADRRGAVGHVGAPALKALRRLYAVGDCATRDNAVFGPVPGGHWSAALHDPDVTVRAILGLDEMPAEPQAVRELLGLAPVPSTRPTCSRSSSGTTSPCSGPLAVPRGRLPGRPERRGVGARGMERAVSRDRRRGAPHQRRGHRLATVRAVLVVDAPREVGQARKLMNRDVALHVDVAVATDPSRRLRDAVV
ncbi:hypothetical protein NKG05_04495 [Oerskovia sp. M15]